MIRMEGRRPELWPEADRRAWEAATSPSGDPWEPGGKALKLRPNTRRNYARAYGIWLAWLDSINQLLLTETPGQRATPARIGAWIGYMREIGRGNGTIKLYLIDLHAMLRLIAPGMDTLFILRPGGQSPHDLFPTEAKPFVPHDTADLLQQASHLHQQAMADKPGLRRWENLRDAALMAVLYSRAPRVSNLAAMRIGEHLRAQPDGSFLVHFPAAMTKSRRKLEYLLDPDCAHILSDYLVHGRPHLCGSATTDLLWMGTTGQPLNVTGVSGLVRRRNRDFTGEAEGPHMVRKWLTDTARSRSPEAAFDAAVVCGHSIQTALKSYAAAQDAHAGKRYGATIARLRRQSEGLAERAFAERDEPEKEVQE